MRVDVSVVGQGFRIFVTASQLGGSFSGIGRASTWDANCPSWPPIWATSTSDTPTGISRRFRNSSSLLQNAFESGPEGNDDRFQLAGPHSTLLHRPAAKATRCEPIYRSGLPR